MNAITPNHSRRGRKPAWPRIRPITERSGAIAYRVDAGQFGGKKRLVKQFPTLAEAETFAGELRGQRAAQREAERFERQNRAVSLANLTDTQRADVLAAFRLLDGTRGTLAGAVDFWKKHAAPANARTVAEVHAELIDKTREANRRERTIYELQNKLAGFVETLGGEPVARITTPDVEAWLTRKAQDLSSPRSRAAYRQALHRLFAFAVKRGYRDANPVAAIDKPSVDPTRPGILRPAQVARLLETAAHAGRFEDEPEASALVRRRMVPWLALSFFAGLRSAELDGLDWGSIDLARRLILVSAPTAKKRRDRYVKMEPNLAAWLASHRQDEGRVFYSRRALRAIEERARVTIPHNGARHSFGSYHLAAFEDAGRTAAQMGHAGDTATLFAHYRALVRPADARAYWRIRPAAAKAGQVLTFPKEAAG